MQNRSGGNCQRNVSPRRGYKSIYDSRDESEYYEQRGITFEKIEREQILLTLNKLYLQDKHEANKLKLLFIIILIFSVNITVGRRVCNKHEASIYYVKILRKFLV